MNSMDECVFNSELFYLDKINFCGAGASMCSLNMQWLISLIRKQVNPFTNASTQFKCVHAIPSLSMWISDEYPFWLINKIGLKRSHFIYHRYFSFGAAHVVEWSDEKKVIGVCIAMCTCILEMVKLNPIWQEDCFVWHSDDLFNNFRTCNSDTIF